ncbi:hypothetical protein BKA69DRAFT_1133808 [Paraphysoderma sedebokerense]|nr:hypothetical protein BKA69DRAFT_1133808 [Paraphysoderma sedebokerense]
MANGMGGNGNTNLGFKLAELGSVDLTALILTIQSLTVDGTTYKGNNEYTITLTGTGRFKGLLLLASDSKSTVRGDFTAPSGYSVMSCKGLGHNSATLRNAPATFKWKAPNANYGDLTISGIVVGESKTSWNILPALKMTSDPANPAPPSAGHFVKPTVAVSVSVVGIIGALMLF